MYYEFENENRRENGIENNRTQREDWDEKAVEEGREEDEGIGEAAVRRPEPQKKTWYERGGTSVKRGIGRLLLSMVWAWESAQKETRKWLTMLATAGILLLLTVIILLVRLHMVSEQLESVQAMSASLQEELDMAKGTSGADEPGSWDKQPPYGQESKVTPPAATPQAATPFPTQEPDGKEKYVVCVDAGHGGGDGGAILLGTKERLEKDDNLRMSKLFCEALEAYGIEVIMTREDDTFLELSERVDIANKAKADAFISLHRNSYAGTEEVSGVEIWIHSSVPKGASELAGSMLEAIMGVGGMENRGVKCGSISSSKEDYVINRGANMTSMIVEFGFITSAADNEAYDQYGETYAKELAGAVYEWLEAQP